MVSKTKDIYIDFAFFNYNPTELSKTRPVIPARDQMEIVTDPEPCCGYQYVQSDHAGKQIGFLQNERRIMGLGGLA